jgi:hypothetical protein
MPVQASSHLIAMLRLLVILNLNLVFAAHA